MEVKTKSEHLLALKGNISRNNNISFQYIRLELLPWNAGITIFLIEKNNIEENYIYLLMKLQTNYFLQ